MGWVFQFVYLAEAVLTLETRLGPSSLRPKSQLQRYNYVIYISYDNQHISYLLRAWTSGESVRILLKFLVIFSSSFRDLGARVEVMVERDPVTRMDVGPQGSGEEKPDTDA